MQAYSAEPSICLLFLIFCLNYSYPMSFFYLWRLKRGVIGTRINKLFWHSHKQTFIIDLLSFSRHLFICIKTKKKSYQGLHAMQSEENLAWLWNLMIKALGMHIMGAPKSLVLWRANDGLHVMLTGFNLKAKYSMD